MATSHPHESRVIINHSLGVIGPIGTLLLESCWEKRPCVAFFPSPDKANKLKKRFRYWVNLKHVNDFLLDLNIPLIDEEEKLYKGIDFILKRKKVKFFGTTLRKKATTFF